FHTLSYTFMPDFITPNIPGKSVVFWNMARVISAPLFLASAYIYKDTFSALINKPVLSVSAIVISIISFIIGIFYQDYIPDAFHEEALSSVRIMQLLITAIIILYASYLYTRRIAEKNLGIFLIYGFIIVVFSDMIYFSHEVPAHFLKIAGFYFIYLSLYKLSVEVPYEKLAIAEEKLRHASEEKYRNLFDNANDAIIIHDIEGRVISWNNAAEKIFGWTAQEITGKKLLPVIIPHDQRAEVERIACSIVPGGLTGFEIEFLRKDGSRIAGSLTVSQLRDASRNVIGISCIIRDITERKRAEDALKKSKEFIETVVNSMNDAISVVDANDFRIIDVNTPFLKIYGLKREDLIGKTCYEITHKRTEPCVPPDDICPLLETLETGKYANVEHVHCTMNGEKRYVEVSTSPIKDETGKVISVIHVARDITERKRAEEHAADLARIVEESLNEIYIFDAATLRFIEVNRGARKNLGYTIDELRSLTPLDLKTEFTKDSFSQLIAPLLGGQQEMLRFTTVHRRKDGSLYPIEVHLQFTFFGSSRVFVAIILDITERKRAEDALKESEEKYRSLVDNIGLGISLISPRMEVLSLNNQMKKWFPDIDVTKKPICYAAFNKPPRDDLCSYCPTCKTLQDGETHMSLTETPMGDKVINYRVVSSPIKDKEGRVVAVVEIVEDITERKKAEELRLENERLALANRAKSEFLSVMSHELRTPMNAVLGFSELLKGKMAGELNEKQEHFVDNILKSGKRQLSLIEDILDLTLIEAKKLELTIEKVAVPETIEETLDLIKPSAASRNLLVKKELDPKLGFIMADRKRFKQIFSNLLDNAVKFSKPEGGTVIVTSKKEGDMAKFSVSDTGIGIKEEDMGKLFRMFQQVDMGTSRRYGGSGIGLAITKQLVELHGGKIWVESKYGEGSTFTFTLPLVAKKKGEN
ncbi:MAG: PAS domain S-box protein, partial [Candidatus Methanoperedens sp.]